MRTIPQQTTQLTATEAAVLGLLRDGPRSGYDLRKTIDRSVGYFWGPAKTQIYSILPRLEAVGHVSRRDVREGNRPEKQLYRITARGRAALKDWLDHGPVDPPMDKSPILLKLFFGADADPDALIEQVRERRRSAEGLLDDLDRIEAELGRSPDDDFFPALTRAWGRAYATAYVEWARAVERAIARRR